MAFIAWYPDALLVIEAEALGPLAEVAGIVAAGARRRCPVSPDGSEGRPAGYLRDHITETPGADELGPYVDIEAEAANDAGFHYGIAVEFGTKPHVIESHGDYPLRDQHGRVFGRRVNHPGTRAQPFMRPAIDDAYGKTFLR